MDLTNLHDWEVGSIQIDREHDSVRVGLYFQSKNRKATLQLDGVQRFHASGMMLQNVILDVLMFQSEETSDYLDHCKKLLRLRENPFDNGMKVLYFEPSVGVEIACHCANFVLQYDPNG